MNELLTNPAEWVWAGLALGADVMVKATVLLLAVCALHLALRRRRMALSRSAVYHSLLAVLVLLPLVTVAVPPLRVPILPAEVSQAAQAPTTGPLAGEITAPNGRQDWPVPAESFGLPATWESEQADLFPATGGEALAPSEQTPKAGPFATANDRTPRLNWAALLLGLYFAGVAVLLLRLIASLRAVARLRRTSRPSDEPAWTAAVQRWGRRLGVSRPVQVAVSDACNVPVAFGALRPMIVIPRSLAGGLGAEHCDSILLHELAHVRRRDYAWQILLRIVQAAYWPNPLIWVFGRLLAAAREQACDDLCAYHESRPEAYRTALLQVARSLVDRPAFSLGIAMARSSHLGGRLARLDRGCRAANCLASWPLRLIVAAAALTIAAVVGSAQLTERAAEAKDEPGTAPAGPAIAQIGDDIKIQLVSVRRNQGEDRGFWQPNGAALPEGPYYSPHTYINHSDAYEFAFRVTGRTDIDLKAAAQSGRYSAELDIPRDASRTPLRDMRVLVRGGFEDEDRTTDISLLAATGAWETVERYEIPWDDGESSRIISRGNIVLEAPRKERNSYFVETTHTYTDEATRVVFIAKDGTEYKAKSRPLGKGAAIVREGWELPESLTLDRLKAIVFLKRPYTHTITCRNVSLQPGQQTNVEVVVAERVSSTGTTRSTRPARQSGIGPREPRESTRPGTPGGFGPIIERVVNDDGMRKDCIIDFETGKLFTPPESTYGDSDAVFKWVDESGVDAMGDTAISTQGLMGFKMIAIPIIGDQWDGDPKFVRGQLKLGLPGTPAVMSAKGELPATFLFQTREGSQGVLQIIGFTENPRGIRIRYKLLQEAGPSTQPASRPALTRGARTPSPVPAARRMDGARGLVYLHGNVLRPGPYALTEGLTVQQLIIAGGGLDERVPEEKAVVEVREVVNGRITTIFRADYEGLFDEGQEAVVLKPNALVFVLIPRATQSPTEEDEQDERQGAATQPAGPHVGVEVRFVRCYPDQSLKPQAVARARDLAAEARADAAFRRWLEQDAGLTLRTLGDAGPGASAGSRELQGTFLTLQQTDAVLRHALAANDLSLVELPRLVTVGGRDAFVRFQEERNLELPDVGAPDQKLTAKYMLGRSFSAPPAIDADGKRIFLSIVATDSRLGDRSGETDVYEASGSVLFLAINREFMLLRVPVHHYRLKARGITDPQSGKDEVDVVKELIGDPADAHGAVYAFIRPTILTNRG